MKLIGYRRPPEHGPHKRVCQACEVCKHTLVAESLPLERYVKYVKPVKTLVAESMPLERYVKYAKSVKTLVAESLPPERYVKYVRPVKTPWLRARPQKGM